ncbi:MAG: T9SS type A sorting domain-containing protein [Flavobacteriales bacterium]|nr:T9SS type A sorting domain-containing protein [Flavobacteriales bacterium]
MCSLCKISDSRILTIATEFSTATERYFQTANPVDTSSWNHFVITYNYDSLSLFVNGQLENRIYKGFNSIFSPSEDVLLGKSGNTLNDRYFNGKIDDVRIYNRVLASNEVDSLYNEPNPSVSSISELIQNQIRIYPNPATNNITMQLNQSGLLEVYSIEGQLIEVIQVNTPTITLCVQHFQKGMYIVRFTTADGNSYQAIFIKV